MRHNVIFNLGNGITARRKMQEKYLGEIKERFQLPVTVMPLLESEIKGLGMIKKASELLFNNKVKV